MHADALGQVAVTLFIVRHQLAHQRQQLEGIEIVGLLEERALNLGKLQDDHPATGLQHPVHRLQGFLLVRHVAQAKGDADAIEGIVGKRQLFGIDLGKLDAAGHAFVDQPVPAPGQHLGVDVGQHDLTLVTHPVAEQRGHVAGSAGQIQDFLAVANVAKLQGDALPDAMDTQRHQIVHQVVLAGHRVEHRLDQLGLVALGHLLEAEMGGLISHVSLDDSWLEKPAGGN